MKIRLGFVSNSSSSSFCLLGIQSPENFDEDKFLVTAEKTNSKMLDYEFGIYKYYDEIIIGASPEYIKDDETLVQFKERICQEFKKFGLDVKPNELKWFIDGGYNG